MPKRLKITKTSMRRALTALGKTEEQVAATLKRLHIKGLRRRASSCPVAKYLEQQFTVTVDVSGSRATVVPIDFSGSVFTVERKECSVVLPRAVKAFVGSFDEGGHSALAQ